MTTDRALPSYDRLFGDLDFHDVDDARSVYSPAAYLADLLQLLQDHFEDPGLVTRRPTLERVPLDAAATYTELPYLDIVNEVLAAVLDPSDADQKLRTLRFPVALPFAARHERLKSCLRHLGVTPAELYSRFTGSPDPDTLARLHLGLSVEDVEALTTPRPFGPDGPGALDPDAPGALDPDAFRRANALSAVELRTLLATSFVGRGNPEPELDGEVRDRVVRFARLARRTGLSFPDLDVVLRSCCGDRIDAAALRIVASLTQLQHRCELPVDVMCSLVAPMEPALVERTFGPSTSVRGDLLAPHNSELRRGVARALATSEADLVTIVERYRARRPASEPGPFDRGDASLADLSLLHRASRLAAVLDISVAELCCVLDVLESDPSIPGHLTFPVPVGHEPTVRDCYRMLDATSNGAGDGTDAADVGSSVCLVQALFAVVAWMQAQGLTGEELAAIVGAAAETDADDAEVLTTLRTALDEVALAPEVFASDRFGERATQVVEAVLAEHPDGVVSARDPRLARVAPAAAEAAAYAALVELGTVTEADFTGLGLGERLAEKIFTNLVHLGVLAPDGTLDEHMLPPPPAELSLSTDFGAYREALAALVDGLGDGEGATSCYPSDLAGLGELTDAEVAELYDNLVFHGYLGPDGEVLRPDVFAHPDEPAVGAFTVNVDLDAVAPAVTDLLRERVEQFRTEPLALDPEIFAPLGLDEDQRTALMDSLRFNGYVDAEGSVTDKTTLADLDLADLNLALDFYPYRRRVLDAVQAYIASARTAGYTVTPDDLADLADDAAAARIVQQLEGTWVVEGRVPDELRESLTDPADPPDLGDATPPGDQVVIVDRIATILRDQQPYRLDLAALDELGFAADERDQLVAMLVARGDLTETLAVPHDRLAFFGTVHNALGYALPGLTDYSTDVFFLLHAVATELAAGIADITSALAARADQQLAALFAVLQDALGLPKATVEAICVAVAGSRADALELLAAPVLAAADPDTGELTAPPADPQFRAAFRRIRRFARLAAKLGLDATEVAVAFADQDLVGKFPEPLALPPGVDRVDALLEGADGTIYLFAPPGFWTYSPTTQALADPRPRSLTELSGRLAPLAAVDAAFTDAEGHEWIAGRDAAGAALAFVREPGSTRWTSRTRAWGTVRNTFTDPARIDAAYVDEAGRTYLFCGDQYVRYSRPDLTHVDEGYPRSIGEWWAGEGQQAPLPERFLASIDAAFEGADGRIHLFAGESCLAVGDGAGATVTEAPVETTWGRLRNTFADAQRIDAAYADGASVCLFAGNQVARYTDCLENDGVRVDEGCLRRIESHLAGVPAEFEGGLEAAFVDAAGVVHLFKDGKTASLSDGVASVAPTVERWGVLGPVLPGGTVDAAFVGLDGKTYLFSGDQYLRYSGADYSVVDVGYPRGIAGDWGGLRRVDASFVLDGATYLFGAAGTLTTLPVEHEADLAAGRVSRTLRQRLAQHGITLPADARPSGPGPWRLTAEHGGQLLLTRTGTAITVAAEPDAETPYYVRYSTRDYTTPDEGHPRPLTDDWWALPGGPAPEPVFAHVDAVFTGRDNRTYLFSGNQFALFDHRRRWWSNPQSLQEKWDSLPFGRVDAAFVGTDGKTYLFSGPQYVRYSDGDYTKVDDRYPAPITTFWGNVANTIARTGRVDAALVVGEHTYLFSGAQYVRYTGHAYQEVDDGYPRALAALGQEPRFAGLGAVLDEPSEPIDAAFADQRNIYLFRGRRWHVVSDTLYRRYELPAAPRCAYLEDGSLLVEEQEGGWRHYSGLEGATLTRTPVRPRTLRAAPPELRTGLDAVLAGVDGNTYLFRGTSCYDVAVGRAYPLGEGWGRPRNTITLDNAVDAAFVGRDGRTYLFRTDQYVVYLGSLAAGIEGGPRPVTDWAGLTSVALAYVHDGRTYLFEKPDASGAIRYVVYSGPDYRTPDPDYPATTDAGFWGIPQAQRPPGSTVPDAVLFEGETMLVVSGEQYLQRGATTGSWSYPRPLTRIWRDLGPGAVTSAFTDAGGATHFFFDGGEFTTWRDRTATPRRPIRDEWARSRDNLAVGPVDAAFVHQGSTTYLFAGDQYVRYSDGDYRFVDAGYPKPLAGNLRKEAPFAQLPEVFEDVIADRVAAGGPVVDAVVANQRSVYVFTGAVCHVVSQAASGSYDIETLGRVRNTIADRRRVDAALVTDAHTFLFSSDQYVRYTGADYSVVDEGYPRTLESSLAADLGIPALPEPFADHVDAAFRAADGAVYLFADRQFQRAGGAPQPIAGAWGAVRTEFAADGALDAAFVAPSGELYAFRGGQYVRYRPGATDVVDEGFPRTIRDDWGDLPADFEDGIDGAFCLEGRTYLTKGERYVRYSDGYRAVDRTYPQPFRKRWSAGGDYRLSDVHTIARFAALARAHPGADGGLAAFLAGGSAIGDPYAYLAELFGWDRAEILWAKRQGGLLTVPDSDRLDIELVLQLDEVFALAGRLGAGPSRIHTEVWQRLFRPGASDADADAALACLSELLALGRSPDEWRALAAAIHDELNVRTRDALVAAVLAAEPGDALVTSRDLFERFLIDVDMGGAGRTSRVREAIAAAQLYVHRYLLNLEQPSARGRADEVRARVRTWWSWMRTYRSWEANRKVFLYPENYLRPELRATKTPAFRALESDLLQGEITPEAVQLAYRRYLDEYTEVSRLTIAGGYQYAEQGQDAGVRSLVLFGRTKTDPRRYYYRHARFRGAEALSTSWQPWLPVGVAIDADTVCPTYAFDRVFVFWATVEAVEPDPAAGTTITSDDEGTHRAVPSQTLRRVKIWYSFHNLTGEWVPAQELGSCVPFPGTISRIDLSVRAPEPQPVEASGSPGPIEVRCAFTVTPIPAQPLLTLPWRAAFDLYPELYAQPRPRPTDDELAPDPGRLGEIFGADERIDPKQVVRFSSPSESADALWFSVDHKGGSFLCLPSVIESAEPPPERSLVGNGDELPEWDQIDAGVELPDRTRVYVRGPNYRAVPATGTATEEPVNRRWGHRPRRVPSPMDGGSVVRGRYTFVCAGEKYFRYTGDAYHLSDPGYPKPLAGNPDGLPEWPRVDAAFRGLDGVEYFFHTERKVVVQGGALDKERSSTRWGLDRGVDAAFVDERNRRTYLFAGNQYVRFTGDKYDKPDQGYPKRIGSDPADNLPQWDAVACVFVRDGTACFFGVLRQDYLEIAPDGARSVRLLAELETPPPLAAVDAAWVQGQRLYLTDDDRMCRYTLDPDGRPGPFTDAGYPVTIPRLVDAAFDRAGDTFVLSGDSYTRLVAGTELPAASGWTQIEGNWGDLPAALRQRLVGSMDTAAHLYLFVPGGYLKYPKTGVTVPRPYEHTTVRREIVRLTSGTAATLNQRLLSGGVPALLAPQTQEIDEIPRFRADTAEGEYPSDTTVTVRSGKVAPERLPASTHLDFESANGPYYWEIFFHAPLLIAQALNAAQRFEDARRWYEYVFDPTEPTGYWRFLPFLALDVDALTERIRALTGEANAQWPNNRTIDKLVDPVLADLAAVAPAFRQHRPLTAAEDEALRRLASTSVPATLAGHASKSGVPDDRRAALDRLQEAVGVVTGLRRQYDLMGDPDRLLAAYQEDPCDPHAIAELRPVAYRRAVVMAYVDNLVDWGDLLFRQYTGESIDEARMLYILAHDLLGARPESLGTQLPPAAQSFEDLDLADATPGDLDLLSDFLTGGGALLDGPGELHRGVGSPYFHIPPNSTFDEYWARVEDRLRKIRQSLNILGISQPVPLFEPSIEEMSAGQRAPDGVERGALGAAPAAPVPHLRFDAVFRKAQELVDKLRGFGAELLDVLERRDAEELGLLQSRQEGHVLGLTLGIRQAQVRIAAENLEEVRAGRAATADRVAYFEKLIAEGASSLQQEQMAMMTRGRDAHFAAAGLKIAAALATALPQTKLGPFILGFEIGGDQIGGALDKAAEVSESFGEAFSMAGELLGVQAEAERSAQDWGLQLATARGDLVQVDHQVSAAEQQLAVAEREAEITESEVAHQGAVAAFLKSKFGNAELYQWMSGQLAGLYFEAYRLAYDMARGAERALQFERATPEGELTFIRPAYWDSRRSGLLAGQALALDLERLGRAALDADARGLEITKRVSLLELDPVAFLRLQDTGTCELALHERMFDQDFPGHFRRQIRTVTIAFTGAEDQPLALNATLTQLGHKTVLAADPKAVKFLLDPKGAPPDTVRADWRPSQQIALSWVDEYHENNGLHELRFDDERYLPFEGTGAVSTWRLRVPGQAPELADLQDVVVTVRYTAEDGGAAFAAAVTGMLKPAPAARFFNVAEEFPDEWAEFVEGERPELVLPFTAELFPGIANREITGIYPAYDLADGQDAQLVLHGKRTLELDEGKLAPTPGLRVSGNGGPGWTFTLDGAKEALQNVGLVLTYKAGVR